MLNLKSIKVNLEIICSLLEGFQIVLKIISWINKKNIAKLTWLEEKKITINRGESKLAIERHIEEFELIPWINIESDKDIAINIEFPYT